MPSPTQPSGAAEQPEISPAVVPIVYMGLASACFIHGGMAAFMGPMLNLGEGLPPDVGAIIKLALSGLAVILLVAGFIVANLGISPAGWERDPVAGWRLAPERLKDGDQPDTAQSFAAKAFPRFLVGLALIEAVAIFGLLIGLFQLGLGLALGLVAVALMGFAGLLPRMLYLKGTIAELREAEKKAETEGE